MAYRRKGFRRRSSRMRWFTPNLWNATQPQLYTTLIAAGGLSEQTSEVALTNLCYGSAPFPGVLNAVGIRAGAMLAERQYYNIRRVVGRMRWYWSASDECTVRQVSVFWAIVRMATDENGQPDAQALGNFPSLAVRDNQDDKKLILAQDVWRTFYQTPQAVTGINQLFECEAEPPLYTMVDKTMRRSFRNEQDIFLATQLGVVFETPIQNGEEVRLGGCVNLRMLGTFGR